MSLPPSVLGYGRPPNARRRKTGKAKNLSTQLPAISNSKLVDSRTALIPVEQASKKRRLAGAPKLPCALQDYTVLALPHGEKYTQAVYVLPPPGRVGFEMAIKRAPSKREEEPDFLGLSDLFNENSFETGMDMDAVNATRTLVRNAGKHQRRRISQWIRWSDSVVPSLMEPFMEYQHITKGGRFTPPSIHTTCLCKKSQLRLTLARWNGTCTQAILTHPHIFN